MLINQLLLTVCLVMKLKIEDEIEAEADPVDAETDDE